MSITPEELQMICNMTVELTKIKQNECKQLIVENFAAQTFGILMSELKMNKEGKYRLPKGSLE